jgi:hypothetical protein
MPIAQIAMAFRGRRTAYELEMEAERRARFERRHGDLAST